MYLVFFFLLLLWFPVTLCVFQECVFEQLEVKQSVFQEIELLVGKDVILSSSTSYIMPSSLFSKVQNKSRCLVSHPVSADDAFVAVLYY